MPAISVDNIGVCYQRVRRRAQTSRFDWLKPWSANSEDFWGLRNVSFTVDSGEILGVIGRNGAGKSTLLRVLTGILPPDEGAIDTTGRITALLSLGAGFLPDLSGRDNILLNGVYLGMPESEMLDRMDDIIEFAGLGDFIDTPIRQYSSGMKARLGFSVASSLKPDILVLDEVLATSDREFQIRARERVDELMQSAKAIVIVTHDLNMVENFCTRVILLDKGHIIDQGKPVDVVKAYRDIHRQERKEGAAPRTANHLVPDKGLLS